MVFGGVRKIKSEVSARRRIVRETISARRSMAKATKAQNRAQLINLQKEALNNVKALQRDEQGLLGLYKTKRVYANSLIKAIKEEGKLHGPINAEINALRRYMDLNLKKTMSDSRNKGMTISNDEKANINASYIREMKLLEQKRKEDVKIRKTLVVQRGELISLLRYVNDQLK